MPGSADALGSRLEELWTSLGDAPIASPKQIPIDRRAASWYRYYAGYADEFVAAMISALPHQQRTLLDPWNGAGTTTSVAAGQGLSALGYDLNPAAVVIAKARLLESDVAASIVPLTRELLGAKVDPAAVDDDDLLLGWMTPPAVDAIRQLARTAYRALVGDGRPDNAGRWCSEISSLAALFYLGFFRVVRETLSNFIGTNPTWFRQRVPPAERVAVDPETLRLRYLHAMTELADLVARRGRTRDATQPSVRVGNSSALPLADGQVDAVITSPPYCTRIDYAVATLPELGALGLSSGQFRALRDRLIGTPTLSPDAGFTASCGEVAEAFLESVLSHPSRASAGYYHRFYCQYLRGMCSSLQELYRVVAPDGVAVFVVQDSYYKDLHVDVPGIVTDMASCLKWAPIGRADFTVQTKAYMNRRARRYRDERVATEAVLAFRR